MAEIEEGIIDTAILRANANPGYKYIEQTEHVQGFLSKQFPTIANPAPLGLCGFALTTFVLSMFNIGCLVDWETSQGVVMGLALFYGGGIQLLAGMWEMRVGNTLGAVAFSSYGGFWMSFAALFIKAFGFLDGYKNKLDLENCVGIYLLSWAIFSLCMTIVSHRTTLLLCSLFFVVFITFLLLAIGKFKGGNLHFQRAGGCFGLLAACMAWYGALAALLTEKSSFFQLPVGNLDPIYIKLGWLHPDLPTKHAN